MKIFIILIGLILINSSCKSKNEAKSKENGSHLSNKKITASKELENDTIVIEMEYFGWSCPCAQWITLENKRIFEEKQKSNEPYGDSLFYYIVPCSDTIKTPDDLSERYINKTFRFTGRFYKEKQYMNFEGEMGPAKTLRYNKVELIKPKAENNNEEI